MLLQERTASATLEDDEEELEDDEVDVDERGDGSHRASSPDVPTSSSASRASSSSRSGGSPTRSGSSATTAPEQRGRRHCASSASRSRRGSSRGSASRRSTSGRSSSSRSCRCCGRGATRGPSHAALYGFACGVGCYGVTARVDPLLRRRRVRRARRSRWPPCSRWRARSSAALARRGVRSPLLTAAAWVRDRGAAGPLRRSAGSRGPTSASRCTTSAPARALASVGGVPAGELRGGGASPGFLLDVRARAACARASALARRWRRPASVCSCSSSAWSPA